MIARCLSIIALYMAVCFYNSAWAADAVPDKTGAFASYCTNHLAECRSKIDTADTVAMAVMLFSKNSNKQVCVVPKGIARDAATRKIVAWLAVHPELSESKTDNGIKAAEKDLWHCQLQIGDGTVPGGPPAKTGAFLTYCANQYVQCATEIVATGLAGLISKESCVPATIEAKDETSATLNWLKQHKETFNLDTDAGITVALDHLWPCR